jgi:hypothetical protein
LSWMNIVSMSYSRDSATECCHGSRSGTISRHSTEPRGAGKSTSLPAASLARISAAQAAAQAWPEPARDSGGRWLGWLAKFCHDSYSWKTPQCSLLGGLETYSETWPRWGMMRDGVCWERTTPALPTAGTGFGSLLPTPTRSDATRGVETPEAKQRRNRTGVTLNDALGVHGRKLNPRYHEWMMGFVIGWNDLLPLEMRKFQQWLRSHGRSLEGPVDV